MLIVVGWQYTTTRVRVQYFKLERSAGPVCVDIFGGTEEPAAVALRPVSDIAVRSEPSLLRLLDTDKNTQPTRARDRFSSFCRKLRRTISECSQ